MCFVLCKLCFLFSQTSPVLPLVQGLVHKCVLMWRYLLWCNLSKCLGNQGSLTWQKTACETVSETIHFRAELVMATCNHPDPFQSIDGGIIKSSGHRAKNTPIPSWIKSLWILIEYNSLIQGFLCYSSWWRLKYATLRWPTTTSRSSHWPLALTQYNHLKNSTTVTLDFYTFSRSSVL